MVIRQLKLTNLQKLTQSLQFVEHEQHGEARADYGKGVLKMDLSSMA